jgi:acyl transferase domain-containing protein/NADPH:quinone reductase-like Zn-dependent oxidoreductase/thioesterase domain-containing protein/acyl carrier protein
MALAGGVSIRVPQIAGYYYEEDGIVSPDGHCRTFDAAAHGTIFGSGVGIVVLKRLADALTDGDHIRAIIKGSAVNNDGGSKLSYTAAGETGQAAATVEALAVAGFDPETVGLVEAHGTATAMGDPVEVSALGRAFRTQTGRRGFCAIGSVKSNIGHPEAAAGVAGLIKAVLALEHRQIPPTLHLEKPNPRINLADSPFYINTALIDWPRGETPRRAGVNSLGLGGTNAFVAVEEPPESGLCNPPEHRSVELFCLSAKTPAALVLMVERFARHLTYATNASLQDVCFTACSSRSSFAERLAVVSDSIASLCQELAAVVAKKGESSLRVQATASDGLKVAFAFPGSGLLRLAIVRSLLASEPVFRGAIERCERLIQKACRQSLIESIESTRDRSDLTQGRICEEAAVFSIGFALAELWQSWGIKPTAVFGDGAGEYTAACVAGVFSPEDALTLILDHVMGSGDRNEPRVAAANLEFAAPRVGLISTASGQLAHELATSADYWMRRMEASIPSAVGFQTLHRSGCQMCVEMGLNSTLAGLAKELLPELEWTWLPSLEGGQDALQTMLKSLGQLWVRGIDVNWTGFYRNRLRRRVALPSYPFQRERFSLERARQDARPGDVVAHDREPPTSGTERLWRRRPSPLKEIQFEARIGLPTCPILGDHRVYGRAVVPGAWHLAVVLARASEVFGPGALVLEDVTFKRAAVLDETEVRTVQLIFGPTDDGGTFQVSSLLGEEWQLHAEGRVGSRAQTRTANCNGALALEKWEKSSRSVLARADFYETMRRREIELGTAFQWNARAAFNDREVLGRLEAPHNQVRTHVLDPGLIDACFQLLIASLPPTYVPLSIDAVRVFAPDGIPSWCHGRFRHRDEPNRELVTADLDLLDPDGQLVLQMDGLSLKRADRRAFLEGGAPNDVERWIHRLEWRPANPVSAPLSSAGDKGSWVFLTDRGGVGAALAGILKRRGHSVITASRDHDCDAGSPYRQLHQSILEIGAAGNWLGIVHFESLDIPPDPPSNSAALQSTAMRCCGSVLSLVQELTRVGMLAHPRLWVVTRGAQMVGRTQAALNLSQAPLWGLGRVIASELPVLVCTLVDLDPCIPVSEPQSLLGELLAPDREDQIAYRDGHRWAARLVRGFPKEGNHLPIPLSEGTPYQLHIAARGMLDDLEVRTSDRRSPGSGEVEIRVCAAGLNFRDVLSALGTYPGDAGPLGLECAGEISAVGPDVEGFRAGDAVVAVGFGCFATHVTTPVALVRPKPDFLSYEKAASIPVAFLTAHYALNHLAGICAGQRVLIHAAAGGVGLAAVQLARAAGAEVFATAGNPGKCAYLRELGIEHVMNSRSSDFAREVLERTDGRGVHIVLNSLSGDQIRAGLSVVRAGGHFIELGKIGIWDAPQVTASRPDLSYSIVALDSMFQENPARVCSLLREVMEGFATRRLDTSPVQAFPITEAVQAFRFMAQAKHIGKLVISLPATSQRVASPAPRVRRDATYVITGGLGALGLQVARWLTYHGARHLLLVGRSSPSLEADKVLRELEGTGVKLRVERLDVAQEEQVARLLSMAANALPPLRGVIHAAGVLDDGVLVQQSKERFAAVMASKVQGAWNLHILSRELPLDFFVMFSSMASVLGPAGQANYAAANAFMDALAHFRRARGLPAVSVNWGPWSGAGMATTLDSSGLHRFATKGIKRILPAHGLEALGQILESGANQIAILPIDWDCYLRKYEPGHEPPLLRIVGGESRSANRTAIASRQTEPMPESASEASHEQLRERLRRQVADDTARVLGLDTERLRNSRQSLNELGLDSLMAVELINAVRKSTGYRLPSALVFNGPSLDALIDSLAEQADSDGADGRARQQDRARSPLLEMIRRGGSGRPFFGLPGIGGAPGHLIALAAHLSSEQPVYGLRAQGRDGDAEPDTDIHVMASRYVEAIRTVDPDGPFFLGGYSYGGTVAFEMAQQLQARGHEVALLAIFDHYPPNPVRSFSPWSPESISLFIANLPYWIVATMQPSELDLFVRRARAKLRRFWAKSFARSRRGEGTPEPLDTEATFGLPESKIAERSLMWLQVHHRALIEYRPQRYPGRVDLFRARTARLAGPGRPDFGWSEYAAGGVRVHIVPGTHATMFSEPYVGALAAKLIACITERQQMEK